MENLIYHIGCRGYLPLAPVGASRGFGFVAALFCWWLGVVVSFVLRCWRLPLLHVCCCGAAALAPVVAVVHVVQVLDLRSPLPFVGLFWLAVVFACCVVGCSRL